MELVSLLLQRDDALLVTLTGTGGVGKTRLARQVAHTTSSMYPDGVHLVPLAPVTDPELVLPTIASVIGIHEAADDPILERLLLALADKRILLVLDNFEQVVAAAGQVANLLGACPQVKALVTSRVPLHVLEEQEYAVLPLRLPPAQFATLPEIAASPAVALFVQRARAVSVDFELQVDNAESVAEVCRRLDGLPLAIELAASRSKVLTPAALQSRLDRGLEVLSGGPRNQPTRLQTMRSAIAWSFDLLSAEDQALFQSLSVFAGGGTVDAAVAVVAADRARTSDVWDGLSSLADYSLLHLERKGGGEARFTLLETTREFGLERLEASGEAAATRQRHAEWCLRLADEAWPALAARKDHAVWLDRLDVEHDNLRAAIAWLDQSGDTSAALRLCGRLFWFWYVLGHLSEGRRWLERALARATDAPDALRARGLLGLGVLAHWQGDDARAMECLTESLATGIAVGDDWGTGFTYGILGIVAEDAGDFARALPLQTKALETFRQPDSVENRSNVALVLDHIGVIAWGMNDLDLAIVRWQEALAIQEAVGDEWGRAISLGYLGLSACLQGRFPEADRWLRESLALHWSIRSQEEVANGIAYHAVFAATTAQHARAARLFGAAQAERDRTGLRVSKPERSTYERAITAARVGLSDDVFKACWARGQALGPGEAVGEALALRTDPASRSNDAGRSGGPGDLTTREMEVLRLLVLGRTDREISGALFVSLRTAQGHVARILAKLGVSSRTAAATTAIAAGLVNDPPVIP